MAWRFDNLTHGLISAQVGTRRYHNFTKNLKASDEQAKRFILEFEAGDPRIVNDSTEWLRLEVVGQSFCYI